METARLARYQIVKEQLPRRGRFHAPMKGFQAMTGSDSSHPREVAFNHSLSTYGSKIRFQVTELMFPLFSPRKTTGPMFHWVLRLVGQSRRQVKF